MSNTGKVVISCAITGSIHTPSMSPYLPVTPDQIVTSALEAAEAGAAILHLHARNPQDGRPDQSVAGFAPIVQALHGQTDAVLNLTTGGAPVMSVAERLEPAAHYKPELASLNMGTMNSGLFPMLKRHEGQLKHQWEQDYLSNRNIVFRNTFSEIEEVISRLSPNGTRFEFECYDTAHLYNLKHFYDRGLLRGPLFIQTVFGLLGGIGTHPEDVMHMRRTADRLFGDNYQWSVLGAGRNQMAIAAISAANGGHMRVGLEDNLWASKGVLARTNAEQVLAARKIVEGLGLEVATPDEARAILGLKGAALVNI